MRNETEMITVVGLLAPIDKTGAAYAGTGVKLDNHRRCLFLVYLGAMDNTDDLTLLVKANTAATAGGTAIAARYKIASTGAATKSVLDATSYTDLPSTGLVLDDSNNNKILAIEVRDTDCGSYGDYVNLSWGSPGAHACLVTVVAILYDARYPQTYQGDPTA